MCNMHVPCGRHLNSVEVVKHILQLRLALSMHRYLPVMRLTFAKSNL